MSRPLPGPPPLDAAGIARVLNEHGVRYVVIGAFAAIAQQAPLDPTRDIDFTPDSDRPNLKRLSKALTALGARIRTDAVEGGLAFDHSGESLGRAAVWNLVCDRGEFDLAFRPAGFENGYEDLAPRAVVVRVDGVDVPVAHLDDVIASKEAAGRQKDLVVLPRLYRFRATREPRD